MEIGTGLACRNIYLIRFAKCDTANFGRTCRGTQSKGVSMYCFPGRIEDDHDHDTDLS